MSEPTTDRALAAYEALAPVYDAFTGAYQAAAWTARLEAIAMRWKEGSQRRLLDVGCGTGKSFLPMLQRGWEVSACDLSPGMIELARTKAGCSARLEVADVRNLSVLGEFDLVWALNDTLNYMMSNEELVAALTKMRANLHPQGILVFDLNTLRSMRELFAERMSRNVDGVAMRWTGLAAPAEIKPGATYTARFEVSNLPTASHDHCQRHFPEAATLQALDKAGFQCLEVWGDYEGRQYKPLDEEDHEKGIYFARPRLDA